MGLVATPPHDDLRRLAVWLARRREVDEVIEILTQYGPSANERVAAHLAALESMLEAEREAFRRYAEGAPVVPQRPLPAVLPVDDEPPLPNVLSLTAARLGRLPSR